jgi:hypothetical protein
LKWKVYANSLCSLDSLHSEMQNDILEIVEGEIQCVVESVVSVRKVHQCCKMLFPAIILCGKGSFDFENVLQLKKLFLC